jgi:flagellar FliJ protein
MSFQFRFQRVLDVREREEDLERIDFAEVQNQYRREVDKLESLKEELDEHYDRIRRQRQGQGGAHRFVQQQEQTEYLLNQIQKQQDVVEEWKEKLEEQREELVEASQRRQVLERLRENEYEEFREDMLRQERRESNEVANRQFYREQTSDD